MYWVVLFTVLAIGPNGSSAPAVHTARVHNEATCRTMEADFTRNGPTPEGASVRSSARCYWDGPVTK